VNKLFNLRDSFFTFFHWGNMWNPQPNELAALVQVLAGATSGDRQTQSNMLKVDFSLLSA
jgi:hypothetical protein